MPERKSQGETIRFFTLMIPEIATQKVEISSLLKTCDMSDILLCPWLLVSMKNRQTYHCCNHSSI